MTAKLDEILSDSEVRAIAEIRDRSASNARRAQSVYERYSVLFIVAGGVATVAGALILLSSGGEGSREAMEAAKRGGEALTPETLVSVQAYLAQPLVRSLLFVVEVFALGFSAYAAEILRSSKSDVAWISERREAEAGRITLFEKIMECAQARDGAGAQGYEVAAFGHFVDQQLAKQMKYHDDKNKKASDGAWKTIRTGAAIAAVIAGVGATGTIGQWWIVIGAFVGVVAPVLMHGLVKYREVKLDREQSESSANTWKILREIAGGVDAAKTSLAAGDPSRAREIVARTHETMQAENQAWTPTKPPI